jgi:hypothetical protein
MNHATTTRAMRGLVLAAAAVSAVLAAGCWGQKQTRRDVYINLMTPLERSQYAYMEATQKPVSLLLAYLQEIGVYQKWAEQPNTIQEAILRQVVVEGMTPLQVQMAWGSPEERREETSPAERVEGHTRIVWEYGIRTQKVGGSSYERSVCFVDDLVLWVRESR